MAELLVFTTDTIGDDVYRTAKLPKRGDVITVQEDGWKWGGDELKDPRFLVLKVPGEPVSTFMPLTSAEVATKPGLPANTDPAMLTNTLQYRGFHVDLDAMRKAVPAIDPLAVPNPKDGGLTSVAVAPVPVAVDAATVAAYKLQKPQIADPAVIGPPTSGAAI